jgi:nucleolar protein 58
MYFVGNRRNAATTDFSSILPKFKEDKLKSSAAQSMGSEISDEDIILISDLCEQVRYTSINFTANRLKIKTVIMNFPITCKH